MRCRGHRTPVRIPRTLHRAPKTTRKSLPDAAKGGVEAPPRRDLGHNIHIDGTWLGAHSWRTRAPDAHHRAARGSSGCAYVPGGGRGARVLPRALVLHAGRVPSAGAGVQWPPSRRRCCAAARSPRATPLRRLAGPFEALRRVGRAAALRRRRRRAGARPRAAAGGTSWWLAAARRASPRPTSPRRAARG